MTDIVDYQPPLGFLGAIANQLIIKSQLSEIFSFRTKQLEAYFGRY
jgi:ligand-binding SRPBCC domain-containing protein